MGQVLTVSGPSLDMMLYGDKSNLMANYLQQQMQSLGSGFNDISQKLYQAALSSYNWVTDKLTQYGIKSELSNVGLNVLDNQYMELLNWEALQQANLTMQRWIMCHPTMQQLYLDQNLDGYSDSYQNLTNQAVSDNGYDLRRVMNGVLIDDTVTHYFEDLVPGDRELDHYEKDIVLNTFSTIDWVLSNCDLDFTNKSEVPTKINRS